MLCDKHTLADDRGCWRCRIAELEAKVERLEKARKRDCVAFFRWWYNQPGANTEQGYDEWAALVEGKQG